jgi:hypothetical protein
LRLRIENITLFLTCVLYCSSVEAQDLAGMGFKKGIKATGGVSLSNIFYNTNDTLARRDPYQFILTGNLNLNLFGYEAPFSFTFTNSQKSYTQPFNRLSFNPQYKWIRLYVGNTSMSFSPYTLSGHSFKGAGVDLTPGNWRISLMGGRLQKAVEYDPLREALASSSYRRMGYGIKFGYEKESSGIIVNLFTAKDDEKSIREAPAEALLHPMQNLAMGISGRTLLFGHLALEGEYSVSILNSDLRLNAVTQEDPDRNEFSTVTTGVRTFDAYSLGMGYQSSLLGMMLKYERIDPDYQSLGAYYFNNDMENVTLSPSLRLMDGKLSVSGNAGLQRNNLDEKRESTTKRFVGAGNLNYNISKKLNVSVNYSNFSTYTNMKPQDDPFFRDNMDSLNFYQVTNQMGGSVNYTFGESDAPGSIMIFTSYQEANETNRGSAAGSSDFFSANATYSKSLKDLKMTVSLLYNMNSSSSPGSKTLYQGPGFNISKLFKSNDLRASFNSVYHRNILNGKKGSPVLSNGFNLSYSPKKSEEGKHNITANINWVQRFRSEFQIARREITATINYAYSF